MLDQDDSAFDNCSTYS